jgi:class 3 adenylate cyclase
LKTGDSFIVSFASVTYAIDCALPLQRAFAEHNTTSPEPIAVRMGLNADLFGSSVILAARIGRTERRRDAHARGRASSSLGQESGVADRGAALLTGFQDAVRLYEVRWRA